MVIRALWNLFFDSEADDLRYFIAHGEFQLQKYTTEEELRRRLTAEEWFSITGLDRPPNEEERRDFYVYNPDPEIDQGRSLTPGTSECWHWVVGYVGAVRNLQIQRRRLDTDQTRRLGEEIPTGYSDVDYRVVAVRLADKYGFSADDIVRQADEYGKDSI